MDRNTALHEGVARIGVNVTLTQQRVAYTLDGGALTDIREGVGRAAGGNSSGILRLATDKVVRIATLGVDREALD
jgi:hypothetical protein